MVNFTLPDDLKDLRRRTARFVAEEVLPAEPGGAEEVDWPVVERLRQKARVAGLFNPHLGPELGGLGLGPLGTAVLSRELGVSVL
ncbi:MAG: acyl-CoA dehydrogenase family protein, partial [Candidatus Dormibacterales bacterium]